MTLNTIYDSLPGKTGPHGLWLPLWVHLEDTAAVAKYLCSHRIPDSVVYASGLDREAFIKVSVFLAMVHDVGKCTPLFFAKLRQYLLFHEEISDLPTSLVPSLDRFLNKNQSPHSRAGEAILENLGCPNGICSIVGAHHGKPTSEAESTEDQLETYPFDYFAEQKRTWEELQSRCLSDALKRAGYMSVNQLPILSNCAQMLLCGVLIQADWIASNQNYFPLLQVDQTMSVYPTDRASFAFEKLSLPDLWKSLKEESDIQELFRNRFGFSPNEMQKQTAEIAMGISCPGLVIVEAQMGTGKTEAAMAAAEILAAKAGCGGVFFGLPTQATSNGMFPRAADWAESLSGGSVHAIRLVHGMAALNEDYRMYDRGDVKTDDDGDGGLIVHDWFSGKKQALLADFVVGTVDTALMAALSQKHVMLRHLGLCGKVVVIDECHAYDAYMSRFLDRMLGWLGAYKTPVILLSATLPQKRKEEILFAYAGKKITIPEEKGYPLITWTDNDRAYASAVGQVILPKSVIIQHLTDETISCDIADRLKNGGCAGIIVNTVRRAQKISEELRSVFPDFKICIYHAQYIAEERIRREKELISMIGKDSTEQSRDKVIVIGTQVLEQSLDIDFDYLITDLCPVDLLLQRIGRLHRHSRIRPSGLQDPVCSVLHADDELESGARSIYGNWLLMQTRRYLPNTIQLPNDIPELVELVYRECDEYLPDPEYQDFIDRSGIKRNKANTWLLPKPRFSRRENRNSIMGMLDHYMENEQHAQASVRDGSTSIDVLIMRKTEDGHIGFLPWIREDLLRADVTPSDEDSRKIAMQRLRLPFVFCLGKKLADTITVLEEENRKYLSAWQESLWIKGELILLMDKNNEKDLCGYRLKYDKEQGLSYERSSV